MLATAASQALLVVLAPTMVPVARELGVSVGAVGQARSVTAAVAVAVALAMLPRGDVLGVPRMLRAGGALTVVACGAVAATPTFPAFLAGHVLVGVAFACLLSAGFAGVAALPADRRTAAMGRVAAANAAAWLVVTPVAGELVGRVSWRAAEALPAVLAVAAWLTLRGDHPMGGERLAALPLSALLRQPSARRWVVAELVAYAAWTAFLTFSGAFFADTLGASPAAVGWLLTVAPAAYLVASVGGSRLTRRASRRGLVAAAATSMAVLLPLLLGPVGSTTRVVVLCCLIGLAAGVRTPASGSLGLAQLPDRPAAMMTARTAVTQTGYLVGAVVGGALIAGPGYDVLGLFLGLGLAWSAALVLRVDEGEAQGPTGLR